MKDRLLREEEGAGKRGRKVGQQKEKGRGEDGVDGEWRSRERMGGEGPPSS